MANARESSSTLDGPIDVVKRQGTTLSKAIRNTTDHTTRTKTMPHDAPPLPQNEISPEHVRELSRDLEAILMPGQTETAGLSDDEILEQELLNQYGYQGAVC